MSSKLAGRVWGEILHHESDRILEFRWLPGEMTDGAFMATLATARFSERKHVLGWFRNG